MNKKRLLMMMGGSIKYYQTLKKLFGVNAYIYPMWDSTGTLAEEISGNAKTGSYNGTFTLAQPGIGDGKTSALFVTGAQSGLNVIAASPINMDEGFVSFWAKIDSADKWSNENIYYFVTLSTDFTNGIYLRKINTQFSFFRRAGGVLPAVTLGLPMTARWINIQFVWSVAAGKVWACLNGSKSIPTTGTVESLTGVLTPASALFGANTTVATTGFSGNMAYGIIGLSVPTDAQTWGISRSNKQVCFEGDSRSTPDKLWHITAMEAAFPTGNYCFGGHGVGVWGVSGATIANLTTNAPTGIDTQLHSGATNILFIWAGINSALSGRNAAQMYSDLQARVAAAKAAGWNKIIVCSEIDGQSVALEAINYHSTIMPAFNALMDADNSFADGYVNLGSDARLQDATNATYFNADLVHLTAAGYAVVAELSAPIIAGL